MIKIVSLDDYLKTTRESPSDRVEPNLINPFDILYLPKNYNYFNGIIVLNRKEILIDKKQYDAFKKIKRNLLYEK